MRGKRPAVMRRTGVSSTLEEEAAVLRVTASVSVKGTTDPEMLARRPLKSLAGLPTARGSIASLHRLLSKDNGKVVKAFLLSASEHGLVVIGSV